ncbi:hypothetical protein L6452_36880 [Arctium lappa]|uniref:Uncharacterized protein n=1 Tax=Arctium lappa TaxID=4217 RepID=A0ACB8Y2K5_ARCLA|nr:hypothetical protein L6452_36880 [Arctium lappa]
MFNMEKKLLSSWYASRVVANDEERDEIPYQEMPKTEFQKLIRLKKEDMPGFSTVGVESSDHPLYDHRPYKLNDDDYLCVFQIPMRKGANFKDFIRIESPNLKGVRVQDDNHVEWDPDVERVYLPSRKPLVKKVDEGPEPKSVCDEDGDLELVEASDNVKAEVVVLLVCFHGIKTTPLFVVKDEKDIPTEWEVSSMEIENKKFDEMVIKYLKASEELESLRFENGFLRRKVKKMRGSMRKRNSKIEAQEEGLKGKENVTRGIRM